MGSSDVSCTTKFRPRFEYGLTDWGQALCPALEPLLKWAAQRE